MHVRFSGGGWLVPLGFATTVSMWAVAYVGRLPVIMAPSWLVGLGMLLVVAMWGWRTGTWIEGALVAGAKVGLMAALLNMLILGSFLSSSEQPGLVPSALWWIPGSLVVTALIAAAAAHVGGFGAKREPPVWAGLLSKVALGATFLLVVAGGLVTSNESGLAVVDWPNSYGYNMFLYPIETWLFGPFDLLVEHGHRLLGSLAGMIAIVLVAVTFKCETRKSVRWLAVAILLLVIAQGVLGGVRVLLDARSMAKIHGCLGPAFFATVVGYCVVTSRWWIRTGEQVRSGILRRNATSTLTTIALLMLIVSFGQLVIGALLRHIAVDASPVQYKILILMHIAIAVVIAFGTFWQWIFSRKSCFQTTGIPVAILVLDRSREAGGKK